MTYEPSLLERQEQWNEMFRRKRERDDEMEVYTLVSLNWESEELVTQP